MNLRVGSPDTSGATGDHRRGGGRCSVADGSARRQTVRPPLLRESDAPDLEPRPPSDLARVVAAHWQVGEVLRSPTAVRVLDSTAPAGRSPVVFSVVDDMPFLVDSMRMASTATPRDPPDGPSDGRGPPRRRRTDRRLRRSRRRARGVDDGRSSTVAMPSSWRGWYRGRCRVGRRSPVRRRPRADAATCTPARRRDRRRPTPQRESAAALLTWLTRQRFVFLGAARYRAVEDRLGVRRRQRASVCSRGSAQRTRRRLRHRRTRQRDAHRRPCDGAPLGSDDLRRGSPVRSGRLADRRGPARRPVRRSGLPGEPSTRPRCCATRSTRSCGGPPSRADVARRPGAARRAGVVPARRPVRDRPPMTSTNWRSASSASRSGTWCGSSRARARQPLRAGLVFLPAQPVHCRQSPNRIAELVRVAFDGTTSNTTRSSERARWHGSSVVVRRRPGTAIEPRSRCSGTESTS